MGWLVVVGLLGVAAMLWLDARPSSWFYSRRAFERPAVLPPTPTDQHDRVPVELTRLPEGAVRNMREIGGRRGRSS